MENIFRNLPDISAQPLLTSCPLPAAALPSSHLVVEKRKALEVGVEQMRWPISFLLFFPLPWWQRTALVCSVQRLPALWQLLCLEVCKFPFCQDIAFVEVGADLSQASWLPEHLGLLGLSPAEAWHQKMLYPKFLFWRKPPDHLWDMGTILYTACTCPPSWSPVIQVHIFSGFCRWYNLNCVPACPNDSIYICVCEHESLYKYTVSNIELL